MYLNARYSVNTELNWILTCKNPKPGSHDWILFVNSNSVNGKPLTVLAAYPLFLSDTDLDLHRSDQVSCISRTSVAGVF